MAVNQYLVSLKFSPFSASFRHIQPTKFIKRTLTYNHQGNAFVLKKCHPVVSRNFKLSSSVCKPWEISGQFSRAKCTSSGHSPCLYSCHNTSVWPSMCIRPLKTSCAHLAFSGHQQAPPQPNPPSLQNGHPEQPSDLSRQQVENSSWLIRLSIENNYLSWCRNVYIATVVGATIHLQHVVPFARDIAFLFFFMAGLNLIGGTTTYLINVRRIRKRQGFPRLGLATSALMALVHITLWFSAIIIYLGYLDEEEEAEARNGTQIKHIIVDVKQAEDEDKA